MILKECIHRFETILDKNLVKHSTLKHKSERYTIKSYTSTKLSFKFIHLLLLNNKHVNRNVQFSSKDNLPSN